MAWLSQIQPADAGSVHRERSSSQTHLKVFSLHPGVLFNHFCISARSSPVLAEGLLALPHAQQQLRAARATAAHWGAAEAEAAVPEGSRRSQWRTSRSVSARVAKLRARTSEHEGSARVLRHLCGPALRKSFTHGPRRRRPCQRLRLQSHTFQGRIQRRRQVTDGGSRKSQVRRDDGEVNRGVEKV